MMRFALTTGLVTLTFIASPWTTLAQTSQPTSATSVPAATAAEDQQRVNDLLALIEGQNSPAVRRTGARELLRQGRPDTPQRLVAILTGANRAAKSAIALAIGDTPDAAADVYVPALIAMLSDAEPTVRSAAAAALAVCPVEPVTEQLRTIVLDDNEAQATRLAAIDALGGMTRRSAIAILIEAIDGPGSPLAEAALAALERAIATDFRGDASAARNWWDQTKDLPLEGWQRLQIRRLVRRSRNEADHTRELERRLTSNLREAYFRTPEADRPAALVSHLSDSESAVRLLGLELVRSKLAEGKPLALETTAALRGMLADTEAGVRAEAVRTIASLRDPADAARFLELLATEPDSGVRQALVNGLGYVGDVASVDPLLQWSAHEDRRAADEAVTALGRLAERGVLDDATRSRVAGLLLERYAAMPADRTAGRERLLGALGSLNDVRCGATFIGALGNTEPVSVRLAAIRGISRLTTNGNAAGATSTQSTEPAGQVTLSAMADALAAATTDADVSVRRAAVETLAPIAASDTQFQALWDRLAGDQEVDEGIRTVAWKGVLRVLGARPPEQILAWVDRLPQNGETQRRRALELLQLAEAALDRDPQRRGELGRVRARLAAARIGMQQLDEAIATYQQALTDLRVVGDETTPQVALELLKLALMNGKYTAAVAAVLGDGQPQLDGAWLWSQLRDEISARLQAATLASATTMLESLLQNPPTTFTPETRGEIEAMLADARTRAENHVAEQVNAALVRLRESPDDAEARQSIVALGGAAAPVLKQALMSVLDTDPRDAEAERRLHDMLREIVPAWPGFSADASLEEKREATRALPV